MNVGLELEILSLVKYNELENFATIICLFKQSWLDSRLKWNISAFNDLSVILRPRHLVWKPDIMLNNAIKTPEALHPQKLHINNKGEVTSIQNIKYKIHCNSPHTSKAQCPLVYTVPLAANSGKGGVALQVVSHIVNAKFYRPHRDWELSRTSGKIISRKQTYFDGTTDQARFSISLKKRIKYVPKKKKSSAVKPTCSLAIVCLTMVNMVWTALIAC